MTNFIIKTHRVGTIYNKPNLFILNKGMNSGKPQKQPFTNSFVILFQTEEDCENAYWIAFSLWKSKLWHQYLVGSVIPFIRLNDFKTIFKNKVLSIYNEHYKHLENIEKLKKLEALSSIYNNSINAIERIKAAILQYYI
jgi:hypothetical protein